MSTDDLDDYIDGRREELEARFRELEAEAEIADLKRRAGKLHTPGSEPAAAAANPDDDLAGMKAALDHEQAAEAAQEQSDPDPQAEPGPLYLMVLCPHCEAKNRMLLKKARTMNPVCGGCKEDLAFARD